jgi:hypothetical protein
VTMSYRIAAVVLALFTTSTFAQGIWRFSNPRPHGNNITDMALSPDGTVWQVGDRGSVYTSTDLDSWRVHESGVRSSLRGVTFFQGKTFISGEAGLILSGNAPDMLSSRSLSTPDWLEGIAASTNALIAVGDNGAIYHSPSGESWTRKGSFTNWLRSVAYGAGRFLAVGEDGFAATSPDGQTWQQHQLPPPGVHLNRAAFINDRFWVVGDAGTVFTNAPNMSFNPVSTGVTNDLFTVTGNASEIVLAGDLIVLLGPTGGSWQRQTHATNLTLAPIWPYYSALWDGRLFLLGGRTGMKVEGFRTNSSSPMRWFSEPQPTRNWLWSSTHVDEVYAAAGSDGTIVTSLDGFNWTREVVPQSALTEILLGIGGNSNALVTVGSGGVILTSPNITTNTVSTNSTGQLQTNRISYLGVFWNSANSSTRNDLQGVAANNSTFVVTGAKGTILVSGNSTNWQQRISGTSAYLSGVTAWPGGFIACGDTGTFLASTDGTLWLPRNSGTQSWIYNVRYDGGKLVAVGQGGMILTSDDGVHWTPRTSGITEWINDVTYAAGRWYAVSSGGWMTTSSNAVDWVASKSITSRSLYGVATDGGQLISVGLEGVILRSELVPSTNQIAILSHSVAASSSLFLFSGVPGQRFWLESAPQIGTVWQSESVLEFHDSTGTLIHERKNVPERSRFFRTRLLAP